jgi:hypothetical protein
LRRPASVAFVASFPQAHVIAGVAVWQAGLTENRVLERKALGILLTLDRFEQAPLPGVSRLVVMGAFPRWHSTDFPHERVSYTTHQPRAAGARWKAMKADIQIYCDCIGEVRARLDVVQNFIDRRVTTGVDACNLEMVFLQLRKALELIASRHSRPTKPHILGSTEDFQNTGKQRRCWTRYGR